MKKDVGKGRKQKARGWLVGCLVPVVLLSTMHLLSACKTGIEPDSEPVRDYRKEMRDFVKALSSYAKGLKSDFIVIPQNGLEILLHGDTENGTPAHAYMNALDGVGQENLLFGYPKMDDRTPKDMRTHLSALADLAKQNGLVILVTDYCSKMSLINESFRVHTKLGYVSFSTPTRELDRIPPYPRKLFRLNHAGIHSLKDVRNFLYLINSALYKTKANFLKALQSRDYDLIIMDPYFGGSDAFKPEEIRPLQAKTNGVRRLVIAYMSIGEAEDYRYYWNPAWRPGDPPWLEAENPDWQGNFKVRYWDAGWQAVLFGNDDSYLKKIVDAGFDGVYLDIIDAFEFFEARQVD